MRKFLAVLLVGPVIGATSHRASAQVPAQTSATFSVGTKLVEVAVVARDKRGPALGLLKDDFTLLDSGKPQDIAFFSVRAFRSLAAARTLSTSAPLPPGVVSNRPNTKQDAPATKTVLLLDRVFTQQTDQIYDIQRIHLFLDRRRKPDGIGIYTLASHLQVLVDVTSDDDQLRRAANSLKGAQPNRDTDTTGMSDRVAAEYLDLYMRERVNELKHAFQAIARHLASVPGRKNLVWITEAFPLLYCSPFTGCIDFSPDMQEAARSLNDANVALYAVDARGLIGALGQMTGISNAESGGASAQQLTQRMRDHAFAPAGPSHIETMNLLAGLTGGDVYFNTNGIDDSIQKAVEDGDVTYSLPFYPSEASQDGKVHKLGVKVARPGVSLRYRENYLATKPQSEVENRTTLEQLVKDSLDATQIGLLAQAAPDPKRPGYFNVRVTVGLHDVELAKQDGKWVGAIEVLFYIEKRSAVQATTRTIEIPDNELAAALEKGFVIDHSIEWQGNSGDLRIVVEDRTSGAAGSLRISLGKN